MAIVILIAAVQSNCGSTAGNTVIVHKVIISGTLNVLNHICGTPAVKFENLCPTP